MLAFERGCLWAMELQGKGSSFTPLAPRVPAVLAEIQREASARLAEAMDHSGPEQVLQRFATGRRCFVARVTGQIAAYGWVSQSAECIGEMEREIQIQADEAYLWDCVTLPPYRRMRLYSALLSHIVSELRREGARLAWIGSAVHNRPSLRGFANAGFRPVMRATYFRLFRLSCLFVSAYPEAPGELVTVARQKFMTRRERAWGPFAIATGFPAHLPACAQSEGPL
jgi:GNAT superfamily N-acetyltransferase